MFSENIRYRSLARMNASLRPPQDEDFRPLGLRQVFGGRYFWLLLLYSVLLLSITGVIAARRHLWWDEIEVYYVVTLPNLETMLRALRSGVDLQPPTYYIPLYYLVKWLGDSSFVLRSIAIFPYWLATLVVYFMVARRTTPRYGFLAMIFVSITGAFSYAFEARPYALVLLFTACAFLSWQLTQERRVRRLALPALALSLASAFGVHYNACLVALPLLVGEAILAARRRALDFPVLVSISSGAIPAVFLLPHILALRYFSRAVVSPGLTSIYYALFYRPFLVSFGIWAALAVWFALRRKGDSDRKVSANEFEILTVAVAGVFLVVPLAYCAISFFTHTYYPRYVLETVIGAAIFLALIVYRARWAVPPLASVLLGVFILALAFDADKRLREPDEVGWGTFAKYSELFRSTTKELRASQDPVVLGAGSYLVALRYADSDFFHRCFYPLATPRGTKTSFYGALGTVLPGRLQTPSYDSFRQQHRRFLMYDADSWVLDRLADDGDDVKIQSRLEHGPLYSVVVK